MKQNSFLVVKCTPLNDQYETDAHREPLCITADTASYEGEGYEIYQIKENGTLELIKEYWEDYT